MNSAVRLSRRLAIPALFVIASVAIYGRQVLAHPGRVLIGTGVDPQIFVWSLAWWPYAILHGLNPIVTHAVWAPVGVNLAWTTSVPGIALPLAPVTLLFGPVVSYNVAAILLPALAASTAYVLCERLTAHRLASVLGGAFFGFSPYMAGHEEGHLHMSSVFLLPVIALLVLDRLEARTGTRSFVLRLGVVVAWQLLLSTEVVLTVTVALAGALVVAYAVAPGKRRALRAVIRPLVAAYGFGALLTAPFVWYALRHFETGSINRPADFPADLANLVIPTRLAWLTTGWTVTRADRFVGNLSENGAYLGFPAIAIAVVYLFHTRRSVGARFLAVSLGVVLIAELGTRLHVAGHSLVALPWRAVQDVPGLSNVLPVRLSVFAALTMSVILASFVARGPGPDRGRMLAALVALLVILPSPTATAWNGAIDRPSFFTSDLAQRCLRSGETVLALPYPNQTSMMVWQAEARFRFRLANGNLRPDPPTTIPNRAVVLTLDSGGDVTGVRASDLLRIAHSQGVSTILVDDAHKKPWQSLLNGHLPAQHLGGATLYRVQPGPSSCGA